MIWFQSEGQQPRDPGGAMFLSHVPSQAVRKEALPFTSGRVSLFGLSRPSTDQMRPAHMRQGNLLYSVYLFKCESHPKIPRDTLRIMVDQMSEHPVTQSS